MAGLCEGGNEPAVKFQKTREDTTKILFIIYSLQQLLEEFGEELFSEHGRNKGRRKKNKCIGFADDMALLAEEDTILRDMLLKLNDSCEQYGMKINSKKWKNIFVGRKIKNVNLRILHEAVDQVGSFKYLWCTGIESETCLKMYGTS
ncbi:hypothetical protein ANN_19643 [Periplaneta americana]|uniref:Reverse transcriptase domain-containing protein n=1 Tax=Periplaneta americana TaxID=6978 RepID=A0ABQ8SAN9_PERAM|nr:hypothetical protein ANN_19643 [Periplaneta americana]